MPPGIEGCRQWMGRTDVPMLLFYGDAGVAIKEPEVAWCLENISNLDVIDLGAGIHFVQETHSETIFGVQS